MEKDYIEIGTKTIVDVFNYKLAEVVLKFNKAHKPFDEPCARLDFKDKLESAQRECERKFGFIKPDLQIDIDDLEKYGDPDRFELEEEQEAYTDKVIEGSRTQVVVGTTQKFRCKQRSHGIGVFVPSGEKAKDVEESVTKRGKK